MKKKPITHFSENTVYYYQGTKFKIFIIYNNNLWYQENIKQ